MTSCRFELRDYQRKALHMLWAWFEKHDTGHPVLNMPGGSGKSVVIAALVKEAIEQWPGTRVLMCVHSKELVEQNSAKLLGLWPDAPMGIVSAAMGRREYGLQVTYGGIGSLYRSAAQIGHIDLFVIDEAHAVGHKDTGMYRKLLADLLAINPHMRIVGFSASPYRLGHGLITEGEDAIFSDIIEPVTILELVNQGYLMPLRSTATQHTLETKGLHTRGGEYIQGEMERAFNTDDHNEAVASEIIEMGHFYRHWLIFCAGIEHSEAVAALLNARGIPAASLTSQATKAEREDVLARFESGQLRAVCNVGILTTGYDFPDLDLIAFLRATKSPGLYLQMAVRGMRIKRHTDHCRVLDFAGVVRTHGPVTAVVPPTKAGSGNGEAPIRVCDKCFEICHASVRVCPNCGFEFPPPEDKRRFSLCFDDIMGEHLIMEVTGWRWEPHTSKAGNVMVKCTYYGYLSEKPITEYFPLNSPGIIGSKAARQLAKIVESSGAGDVSKLNDVDPPSEIYYVREGKYKRVLGHKFAQRGEDMLR